MRKVLGKKNGSCGPFAFRYHIGTFPTLPCQLPQLLKWDNPTIPELFSNIPELCTPPILHQTSGQVSRLGQVPSTRDDGIYLNNKLGGLLATS